MARNLKPQKVDAFHHGRLGVNVDLFLDRNDMTFFADLNGQQIKQKSMDLLRSEVRKAIEASVDLKWDSVIELERLTPFSTNNRTFVGFTMTRYWVAQKSKGSYLEYSWFDENDSRVLHNPNDNPAEALVLATSRYGKHFKFTEGLEDYSSETDEYSAREIKTFYFRYSAALWDNLTFIQGQIKLLRHRLNDLFSTPQGIARLEQPGIKLLSAGGTL